MKKKAIGIIDIFILAIILFLEMIWLYAWHDSQTSEGVGLYFSILAGQTEKKAFDLATDLGGFLIRNLLVFVPCFLSKRANPKSMFRILSAATAFLPIVKPGNLVHFPDNLFAFEIRQELLNGQLALGIWKGFSAVLGLFQVALPVLVIMLLLGHWDKAKLSHAKKSTTVIFLIVFSLLTLFGILCEDISSEMNFMIYYLILIFSFSFWEKALDKNETLNHWSLLFFFLLAVRGIYRNMMILSMAHL